MCCFQCDLSDGRATGGASRPCSSTRTSLKSTPSNEVTQKLRTEQLSRFAVWQDSQNFVMTMEAGRATHGIGMYAVITTSKLITTEKAAKSISDARSGIPSRCHGKTASRKRRPSVLSLGAA